MDYYTLKVNTEFDQASIRIVERGIDISSKHGRIYLMLSNKQLSDLVFTINAELQERGL